jgi:hypothetical protein
MTTLSAFVETYSTPVNTLPLVNILYRRLLSMVSTTYTVPKNTTSDCKSRAHTGEKHKQQRVWPINQNCANLMRTAWGELILHQIGNISARGL